MIFLRIAIVDDIPEDREHLNTDISRWAKERRIPLIPAPALYESGECFLENSRLPRSRSAPAVWNIW